ncbi:MAG: hypothetical protein ABIS36_10940 [Chryseolinea sp.]
MQSIPFEIRPMTLKELAAAYNVSKQVMRRWIKACQAEIGKRIGHFFNLRQIGVMVKNYGHPRKELHEEKQP